jgi:hypothetical protein
MHIHDSAMQGLVIFAMVLLFGTAWRMVAIHLADTGPGKAMAFMY